MKHGTQPGSAFLIIFLVLSAVTSWGIIILKSSSFAVEMSLCRQKREQIFRITEGVMRYGIYLCKQRFLTLQKQAATGIKSYDFELGRWRIPSLTAEYTGRLFFAVHENEKAVSIKIQASLYDDLGIKLDMITCQLVGEKEGDVGQETISFMIHSWSIGNGNDKERG